LQKQAPGMIWFLVTYLLFKIGFDHWGQDDVTSRVIYFFFQYAWVGALCLYFFTRERKMAFIILGCIFVFLAIDELLYLRLDGDTYKMMVSGEKPVFILTISALILFIIYEILKWKKRLA